MCELKYPFVVISECLSIRHHIWSYVSPLFFLYKAVLLQCQSSDNPVTRITFLMHLIWMRSNKKLIERDWPYRKRTLQFSWQNRLKKEKKKKARRGSSEWVTILDVIIGTIPHSFAQMVANGWKDSFYKKPGSPSCFPQCRPRNKYDLIK